MWWLPPSESRQTFAFATTQTSRLLNLILSRQTGFFEFEHPFIDKPMVIIKPAIASRPGFETNPSNMPRMLKRYLTRFMQDRGSERKTVLAGWNITYYDVPFLHTRNRHNSRTVGQGPWCMSSGHQWQNLWALQALFRKNKNKTNLKLKIVSKMFGQG